MNSLKPAPSPRWNRRDFLKAVTLTTGAVVFGVPTLVRGKNLNSKLNVVTIGAGGKGASDTNCCNTENIFALCDVDSEHCAGQLNRYPEARFYRDYRAMFAEVGDRIDAVNISTPDHVHAIATAHAMRLGKPVYCQKPLTQTIYEARYLRDLAHSGGVVTQMGNQGSAADGLRRAVECIQSGLIGQVREVHIWSNRPVWPQGINRPAGSDPVPESLAWDLWLGPAPVRPYKQSVYHPFNWRGWLDFGTSALGDMACHTVNLTFRALQLGYPTEIEAEALGGMNPETYPLGSKIRFQFPARRIGQSTHNRSEPRKGAELLRRRETGAELAPVTLWWYDGGKPDDSAGGKHDGSNKPPKHLLDDIEAMLGEIPGSGCLLIGDQGTIFSPDDYGGTFFVKLAGDRKFVHFTKSPAVAKIPQVISRNPFKGDNDRRHHLEWIAAIKAGRPQDCYSRFEIGAQLTEIMLLGCVALRVGKKIQWDGPNMRAINCPEAAPFIQRENRQGWVLA
jgi:predicted dehydrogenase